MRNILSVRHVRKAMPALFMLAGLVIATFAASTPADAQRWGWRGGGFGWGGGLGWRGGFGWRGYGYGAAALAGAAIGYGLASPYYGYGYGYPSYGYGYGYPAYGYGYTGLYSYYPSSSYYAAGCTCQ